MKKRIVAPKIWAASMAMILGIGSLYIPAQAAESEPAGWEMPGACAVPQGVWEDGIRGTLDAGDEDTWLRSYPGAASEREIQEGTHQISSRYNGTYGSVPTHALTECADGSLMQVQLADKGYDAIYYDEFFVQTAKKHIAQELPLYGGFYAGTDGYYYILSGQENDAQSDTREVFRVTKYDASWNKQGTASLYGANTTLPFRAGSASMADANGYLIVRTCHQMYTSSDGLRHQANVTFQVDTAKMEVTESFTMIGNVSVGYVSHSFNQRVKVENDHIVAVDHGDAYPRSVVLCRYGHLVSSGTFYTYYGGYNPPESYKYVNAYEIAGTTGNNYTGVSLGGFEISSSAYLIAINSVNMGKFDSDYTRNVYVVTVPKNGENVFGTPVANKITSYSKSEDSAGTPVLVDLKDGRFLLLWQKGFSDPTVYYTLLDGNGKKQGDIYKMEGELSDCQPIVYGGNVLWYNVDYEGKMTFYRISTKDITDAGHMQKATVKSITLQKAPAKTVYTVGETLDLTGGELLVTYTNGREKTVAMKEAAVSGFDSSAPGAKKLTLKYGGKSLKLVVYVSAKPGDAVSQMTFDGEDVYFTDLSQIFDTVTAIGDASAAYRIDLNKDVTQTAFKLPTKTAGITINGNGHTIYLNGVSVIATKTDTTFENVKFVCRTKKGASGKFTISAARDLTLRDVTADALATTVKGKAKFALSLSDCDKLQNVQGFGKAVIDGAVSVEKVFNIKNVQLTENALLKPASTAKVTIAKQLTGKSGAAIRLESGMKPIRLSGSTEGAIRLVSDAPVTEGTQLITGKNANLAVFDLSGIRPDDGITYVLRQSGNKVLFLGEKFAYNGKNYTLWTDIVAEVNSKADPNAKVNVTLLADSSAYGVLKLPKAKKYASLTLDGNGHTLTMTGNVALTADTEFRNLKLKCVTKKGVDKKYTIKSGKYQFTQTKFDAGLGQIK